MHEDKLWQAESRAHALSPRRLGQGIGRRSGDNRGGLVLFITQKQIDSFVLFLAAPELAEDPADWVVNYLSHAAQHFSVSTKYFASVYLVIHGLIKLFLVTNLLRERQWAYPLSLWFLCAFIVYQCYRFTHTHSIWLVLLTVMDLVVVILIWREYRWCKQSHGQVIS